MIDLHFASTPNGQRALVALEEAALPYRLHALDLFKGVQRAPEFLQINPLGAVPVLIDPDGPGGKRLVLTQSLAIGLYVAEKSGALIPADARRRVEMFRWLMLSASDIGGTNTAINQMRRSAPEKSEANVAFFEGRLLDYLAVSDAQLRQHDYLAEEFTLADIALYPFAAARRPLIDRQDGLSGLRAWMDRMAARPGVAKAMAVTTMRSP